MPDTSHYSQLPVPTYSESPDGPVAFSNLRSALAPHINLFATTEADRDTRYVDAPDGTIVSSSISAAVWKKVAGAWVELYSDEGKVLLASGAWEDQVSDIDSWYWIKGGLCTVYIHCTYTGDVHNAGDNGNIADIKILAMPSEARPMVYQTPTGSCSSGSFLGCEMFTSGGVRASYILGGPQVNTGDTISMTCVYRVA